VAVAIAPAPQETPVDFDPAEWQWQDKSGQIFQIEDLTRDDSIEDE